MTAAMRSKGRAVPVPCPVCGARIFDCDGVPGGEFAIEIKCRKCGLVRLSASYVRDRLAGIGRHGTAGGHMQ